MGGESIAVKSVGGARNTATSGECAADEARVLIVAIGNPLRSDDGLALHAADLLEEEVSPAQAEILRLHQLTPEMAETVRRYETVIFVDAAAGDGRADTPGEIRIKTINAEAEVAGAIRFSHVLTPAALLAMAADLYGAAPRAYWATLTGKNFDHGESLSPEVVAALPELVDAIASLEY